jgi:demethylmenaquinone methyltransferase/2-methoxy-6-polyprenyl-1,4-benzoquinol methylase
MLRVATSRTRQVQWVQADAMRLPFPDNSFDVVSVGYGIRNLADTERGLREVLRVLRPGGKLVTLDFGKPEARALRSLYFGYLRTVLPLLGRLFCGDPDTHAYILASLADYPAQRGLKALMESCGYADCGFEEFCGGTMAINFGRKPR